MPFTNNRGKRCFGREENAFVSALAVKHFFLPDDISVQRTHSRRESHTHRELQKNREAA